MAHHGLAVPDRTSMTFPVSGRDPVTEYCQEYALRRGLGCGRERSFLREKGE